jgi:hypothetical protein
MTPIEFQHGREFAYVIEQEGCFFFEKKVFTVFPLCL